MEEGEVACPDRGSSFAQHTSTTTDSCAVGHITINTLPDEVLLGIFDFCVNLHEVLEDEGEKEWETLVHVCRRWRYIVFASPHRLKLRLVCTAGTRVEEMLDIWPALPIDLRVYDLHDLNEDNVIATLEHNDRICEIYVQGLDDKDSFERFVASMQVPFPALTDLSLATIYFPSPAVPDSFLGGFALGLRSLCLNGITVLGLPNLLLSATTLIRLRLENIPLSGHIPPHVMADCLSSLAGLEELRISFILHYPYQTSLRPPPLTRTILRKLTSLSFEGTSEYLEVLFTWIDAPLHENIYIKLFDPVIFDISQISLFNGREELIQAFDRARMRFNRGLLDVTLSSQKRATGDTSLVLRLSIKCGDLAWQLQSLSQSRSRFSPPLDLSYGRFDVTEFASGCSPPWARDVEKARWLEFLHFFAAVENLYLSEGLVLCIAPTLRDLAAREGGSVKVLPALKSLFIEKLRPSMMSGTLLEIIGEFIVAREFAGHPVVFQYWKEERK